MSKTTFINIELIGVPGRSAYYSSGPAFSRAHIIMQLSIVTLAPHYPGIAGTCPGIEFCTLIVMSIKVQPRVLPGTAGDIFLVNPQVGPRPITPGAFSQSPSICVHPGVVDFRPF